MTPKDAAKILHSAANELGKLIEEHNKTKAFYIHANSENEPDYHDFQTCHELHVIAKMLQGLPK
jgi:hypothetical protein